MKNLIVFLLLAGFPWFSVAANIQQLIQLADYIGVDYGEALENGIVINAGEYAEMQDFSAALLEQVAELPASAEKKPLAEQSKKLASLVEQRADAQDVKALTTSMRQLLISGYDVSVTPRHVPDIEAAGVLYSQQCASCHGVTGHGDGPAATLIDPPPIDFFDSERYRQRSLLGFYNTITLGVEGTAMQSYASLTENERWSLAFYVGRLAVNAGERSLGEALWRQGGASPELGRLAFMTTNSPDETQAKYGDDGTAIAAFLRTNPTLLFKADDTQPLDNSLLRMAESLASYQAGDKSAAYKSAVKAYLEGFELVEGNLDAVDARLRKDIESAMTSYRNLIRHNAQAAEIVAESKRISELIAMAQNKLDETVLSGFAAFISALLILLREGLEALLVIAALAAFLIKTERRDGLVYLYAGIAGALVLGGVTWVASNTVIDVSGMQRELTEGFAALFAAIVLFSVGFWMHSKTSAVQWKQFIENGLKKHLGKGTLWGLAGLSFIAVYREMFEVVLFYQALWVQTDPSGQTLIVSGLLVATGALLILGWIVLRYSTRLPLRQFFAISGIFMLILALVFTGKGIAALQEAGKLPVDPINFPAIELLGIYPNLQSLSVQAALLGIAIILLFRRKPEVASI